MRLPQQLQSAMAAEAEAAREARAKVIAAEGEHKSSRALAHAAEVIGQSPAALQVIWPFVRSGCWGCCDLAWLLLYVLCKPHFLFLLSGNSA